jgi:hypothetical protein
VAPCEQPLGVVEAPSKYSQLGEGGAHLTLGARFRVRSSAECEAEGHLGCVPAADVAEDEPEIRAAAGVQGRWSFVDAETQLLIRRASPLIGSAQVTDSCA